MPARGPYAKGAAKRAEIIEVALEVVGLNGCRKTHLNEIAERVGLTSAGLSHYFTTREELYEAVLAARDERDELPGQDAAPDIESLFRIVRHNQDVPGLVQLYAEYSAEAGYPGHPSHAFFRERYERIRALLIGAIEKAQLDGVMGPNVDPADAARLLLASADGLQIQWMLDRDLDMAEALRTLWRTMCRASHVA